MSERIKLLVVGERMLPDLVPGDVCVVDSHLEPKDGDLVWAERRDGGGCIGWYKQIGLDDKKRPQFEVGASNSQYPPYRKRQRDGVRVAGVVVEVRHKLRRGGGAASRGSKLYGARAAHQ